MMIDNAHALSPKPPLICLLGATATGKTALAVAIARAFPCEIVSVDSVMVYRGMDIGSAKPDQALLQEIPHHLIDICDPSVPYNAGHFREDALKSIASIYKRGRIPLLVGGTMLYHRLLQQGLAELPPANEVIRQELIEQAAVIGWSRLHERLAKVDPIAAQKIHQHDSHRIARALEVFSITGTPISVIQQAATSPLADYQIKNIMLMPPSREWLHEQIANRFDEMLAQGLVAEVRSLYQQKNLHDQLPAIRSAGYAQVWAYLAGKADFNQMRERAIAATRQLAKRQLTWLRSNTFIRHQVAELQSPGMSIPPDLLPLMQQAINSLV